MSAALQKGAALPCGMERPEEVGRRHGVAVIEDAACAIGSEILWDGRWEKIGRPRGDVACFSSECAQQRTLLLFLFPGITVDEQATVVGGVRQACPVVASHTMVAPARPAPNSRIVGAARATDMA